MDLDRTNGLYRSAQIRRWGQHDFVIGIEILPDPKGKPSCELCQQLSGPYPKTFRWTGWHYKCTCVVIPILIDPDEPDAEVQELLGDTPEVLYLPDQFLAWYMDSVEDMNQTGVFPDFALHNIDLIIDSFNHHKLTYK